MNPFSIYLHIPFCIHRCSYCDFNTYSGIDYLIPEYSRGLCREIELLSISARLPVHTIFFGGGTPSLLPIQEVERILSAIRAVFDVQPGAEVTMEANPGTLSLDYLKDLHASGINRLSLGMQSANPGELRLLERQHDFSDVIRAVSWARSAGFDNLNLDLIFGLPYQTMESWEQTLTRALDLKPDHFSLYALTLEHGTPMQHWVMRGLLNEADQDLAADMYERASERLDQSGYGQYEISNWAKIQEDGEPLSCRHNLQYWRNQPYLGFGAGAHGYAGGYRTANVLVPAAYIQRCSDGSSLPFPRTPATVQLTPISRGDEIGESMMMGLRLTREGVSADRFYERFGASLQEMFEKEIDRFLKSGLLEWAGEGQCRLRLTQRGRLLGNQVFMEFLQIPENL